MGQTAMAAHPNLPTARTTYGRASALGGDFGEDKRFPAGAGFLHDSDSNCDLGCENSTYHKILRLSAKLPPAKN